MEFLHLNWYSAEWCLREPQGYYISSTNQCRESVLIVTEVPFWHLAALLSVNKYFQMKKKLIDNMGNVKWLPRKEIDKHIYLVRINILVAIFIEIDEDVLFNLVCLCLICHVFLLCSMIFDKEFCHEQVETEYLKNNVNQVWFAFGIIFEPGPMIAVTFKFGLLSANSLLSWGLTENAKWKTQNNLDQHLIISILEVHMFWNTPHCIRQSLGLWHHGRGLFPIKFGSFF